MALMTTAATGTRVTAQQTKQPWPPPPKLPLPHRNETSWQHRYLHMCMHACMLTQRSYPCRHCLGKGWHIERSLFVDLDDSVDYRDVSVFDLEHQNLPGLNRVFLVVGQKEKVSSIEGWLHAATVVWENTVSVWEGDSGEGGGRRGKVKRMGVREGMEKVSEGGNEREGGMRERERKVLTSIPPLWGSHSQSPPWALSIS